jgi:hypothetical protein
MFKFMFQNQHPMSKRHSALPAALCILSSLTVAQPYQPLGVSGFTFDAVAENTPAIGATSSGLDAMGAVLYNMTYGSTIGSSIGLPNNGLLTSGARAYQLQPYQQNNTAPVPVGLTTTLLVQTPAAQAAVSILAFAVGGTGTVDIGFHFTDNTSFFFTGVSLQNWLTPGNGLFVTGRVNRNNDQILNTDANLFTIDVTLPCPDRVRLLNKLTIHNQSATTRAFVLAVSSVTTQPAAFLSPTIQVCVPGPNLNLADNVNIAGGTFAGPGLNGSILTPSVYGGNTVVVVNYGDCSSNASASVFVQYAIQSQFVQNVPVLCNTGPTVNLSAYVNNAGTFSGFGVTGVAFNPGTAGAGTHVVTHVTSTNNCTSSSTIAVSVASLAPPQVTIPSVICSRDPVFQTTANPVGGVFNSTSGGVTMQGLVTPSAIAAGSYAVIYSVTSGPCISSASVSFVLVQTPTASIAYPAMNPVNIPVCDLPQLFSAGGNGTFTGSGMNGLMFYPAVAGIGSHIITLKVQNGICTDTASVRINVVQCLALNEQHVAPEWSVYPNPVSEKATVQLNRNSGVPATIMLYDGLARMIKGFEATATFELDMDKYPPGAYFLRIISDGRSQTQRIQKIE